MRGNIRPLPGRASAGASLRPAFDAHPDSPIRRGVRLVLVEAGTPWLAVPDAGNDAVEVVQSASERPTVFAVRAVREILAIELSGRAIDRALLLWAPRFDPESTAARLLIARGLIAHAASVGSGTSTSLPSRTPRFEGSVVAAIIRR